MKQILHKFAEPHVKDVLAKGIFTSEFFLCLIYLVLSYFKNDLTILGGALVVVVYVYTRAQAKKDMGSTNVSHITIDKTG